MRLMEQSYVDLVRWTLEAETILDKDAFLFLCKDIKQWMTCQLDYF